MMWLAMIASQGIQFSEIPANFPLLSIIEFLNKNNGAIQAIVVTALALITLAYALFTKRLVEETKQAREDSDKPQLLVEVTNLSSLVWVETEAVEPTSSNPSLIVQLVGRIWARLPRRRKPTRVLPESHTWRLNLGAAYPDALECRVVNLGKGGAKDISIMAAHPSMSYRSDPKAFLIPGEAWTARLEAWPFRQAVRLNHAEPAGWSATLRAMTGIQVDPLGFDFGLLLSCTDAHERPWITYVKFATSAHSTMGAKPIRTLIPDVQRILPGRKP